MQVKEEDAAVNRTSRKALDKQRANVALIRHIVGSGIPVAPIDYDSCLRVLWVLSRVPTNWTKHYKNLPLEEAIDRAAAAAAIRRTADRGLSALRAGSARPAKADAVRVDQPLDDTAQLMVGIATQIAPAKAA